jgi:hypothetical protein
MQRYYIVPVHANYFEYIFLVEQTAKDDRTNFSF